MVESTVSVSYSREIKQRARIIVTNGRRARVSARSRGICVSRLRANNNIAHPRAETIVLSRTYQSQHASIRDAATKATPCKFDDTAANGEEEEEEEKKNDGSSDKAGPRSKPRDLFSRARNSLAKPRNKTCITTASLLAALSRVVTRSRINAHENVKAWLESGIAEHGVIGFGESSCRMGDRRGSSTYTTGVGQALSATT